MDGIWKVLYWTDSELIRKVVLTFRYKALQPLEVKLPIMKQYEILCNIKASRNNRNDRAFLFSSRVEIVQCLCVVSCVLWWVMYCALLAACYDAMHVLCIVWTVKFVINMTIVQAICPFQFNLDAFSRVIKCILLATTDVGTSEELQSGRPSLASRTEILERKIDLFQQLTGTKPSKQYSIEFS